MMNDKNKIFEREVKRYSLFQVVLLSLMIVLTATAKIIWLPQFHNSATHFFLIISYFYLFGLISFGVFVQFSKNLPSKLRSVRMNFRLIRFICSALLLFALLLFSKIAIVWFSIQFLSVYVAELIFEVIYFKNLAKRI